MNPIIMLGEPIVLDIETKGLNMNEPIKESLPTVQIGGLKIVVDVKKPTDKFVIIKKYKGSNLFYKQYRQACTSVLNKATHFDSFEAAEKHFNEYIKLHWKHTKAFKIVPASNFFISGWKLESMYGSKDLNSQDMFYLRNYSIPIESYKKGYNKPEKLEDIIKKIQDSNIQADALDDRHIADLEMRLKTSRFAKQNRLNKLQDLINNKQVIQELIDTNTTDVEKNVTLIYGKEE